MYLYRTLILLLLCAVALCLSNKTVVVKRLKRALQKEHEKPQPEKWAEAFLPKNMYNYQLQSLVNLLHVITKDNLNGCTVMVLYDASAQDLDKIILERLLKKFPQAYVHGNIESNLSVVKDLLESTKDKCVSYMLFLKDVMRSEQIIGKQNENKVIIVSKSSQWRVHEFLSNEISQNFVNLLVIAKSEKINPNKEQVIPYILYTHKLYTDGLGSSKPHILMSWYRNKLTKPSSQIFPKKMDKGFAGHRFVISVADQPPFVIKRGKDSNDEVKWDGLEIRLIKILGETLNFTIDIHEASDVDILGSGDAVVKVLREGKANLGLAGMYVTRDRVESLELSNGYAQDCAAFITLTSTALPRYRAIMGPFQWTVWLALTLVYLFAILPLAFSDRLSLRHLIDEPGKIENMFWYVFGTFTNCFTFSGKESWSRTEKMSTRLFIGWYWIFTIIVSACYTGSIIAFVTFPVFPTTIDTTQQLINGRYQIGTLNKGGWQHWFENSTDKIAIKIMKDIEYLPDVDSGLRNISRAFFWPYAFLGSRDQLDYIVRTNFTTTNKRALLHITRECFAPFSVSAAFPKSSIYKNVLSTAILKVFQSGLMIKLKSDFEWDNMKSATGKFLQANSAGTIRVISTEDRALTLQDTQGMFLLLGAGFLMGAASLLSEWLGGCLNFCKSGKRSRYDSIATNTRSFHIPTAEPEDLQYDHCKSAISISSDTIPALTNYQELLENPVIVHNNGKECENSDIHENCNSENETISQTDESSDLDYEISKLFNFDHLFGEDNSIISEDIDSTDDFKDHNQS